MTTTVCVASSFPEEENRNTSIVSGLFDGFRDLLGAGQVHKLLFGDVARAVSRLRPSLLVLVGSAIGARCDYLATARACSAAGTLFAFWTVEDPYEFDAKGKFTSLADVVFSNDAWAARFYDRPRVYHLPTAASNRLARSVENYAERPVEVFFCGAGFANRRRFMADALPLLELYRTLIVGSNWTPDTGGVIVNRRLSHASLIEHYGSSQCVLNLGRDFSYANNRRQLPAVTPGPRTFEAAMVGCVQICFQPSQSLTDFFELNQEIIAVDTVEELGVHLQAFMEDPLAAQAIAAASQRRALADHSFGARAQTILSTCGLAATAVPSLSEKVAELSAAPLTTTKSRSRNPDPVVKRAANHRTT